MHPGMIQDLFSMILVEYYIEKYENFLKFTFYGFAAHLKDFVSERKVLQDQGFRTHKLPWPYGAYNKKDFADF